MDPPSSTFSSTDVSDRESESRRSSYILSRKMDPPSSTLSSLLDVSDGESESEEDVDYTSFKVAGSLSSLRPSAFKPLENVHIKETGELVWSEGSFPINKEGSKAEYVDRDQGRFVLKLLADNQTLWLQFETRQGRHAWVRQLERTIAVQRPVRVGNLNFWEKKLMSKKKMTKYCELFPNELRIFDVKLAAEPTSVYPLPWSLVVQEKADDNMSVLLMQNGDEGAAKNAYVFMADNRSAWIESLRSLTLEKDQGVLTESLHEGYLFGGRKKTDTKKLYTVLMEDKLVVYKKMENVPEKPLDQVLLPGGAIYAAKGDVNDADCEDLAFTIASNGDENEKPMFFSAEDPRKLIRWNTVIKNLLASKDSQKVSGSIKEGYLFASKNKTGLKKRYVVLEKDRLSFYKSRNDEDPDRSIELLGVSQVTLGLGGSFFPPTLHAKIQRILVRPSTSKKVTIDFMIAVSTTDDEGEKPLYFDCGYLQRREEWMEAFTKTIDSLDGQINPYSLFEGYLEVGKKATALKQRYVVLTKDKLEYFKKYGDEKEAGTVLLPEGAVVDIDEKEANAEEEPSEVDPGLFYVSSSGDSGSKRLWLQSIDFESRGEWMNVVGKLLTAKLCVINKDSIREGYMYAGSEKKKMKKYFCILLEEEFQYFKKRGETTPAGVVKLPGGGMCEWQAGLKKLFAIAPTGDEKEQLLFLKTNCAEQSAEWYNDITDILDSKNSRTNPDSLMEGYLFHMNGKISKSLRKRYVVLLEDNLLMYKRRNDTQAMVTIPIPDGFEVGFMSTEDAQMNNAMYIAQSGDEHEPKVAFSAKNASARLLWMTVLLDLSVRKNNQVNKSSIREGYNCIGPKMKKRFCILLKDRFQYFKKRCDQKPEGQVMLPGGAVVEKEEKRDDNDENIDDHHCFKVAATGDESEVITNVYCESQTKLNSWIETIQGVLHPKNSQKEAGSLKEGYLMTGWKKTGLRKRYVVLTNECMKFFKSRRNPIGQEEGNVWLPGGAECDLEEPSAKDPPHLFWAAKTGDAKEKKLYLSAKNQGEMEEWVQAIDNLIDTKTSEVNPNSIKEGYLLGARNIKSKPKKFYHILLDDRLQVFRQRNDALPIFEVLLEGGAICKDSDRLSFCKDSDRLSFYVGPTGDENEKFYYCLAKTEEDLKLWKFVIMALLQTKDHRKISESIVEGYASVRHKATGGVLGKWYIVLLKDKIECYKGRNATTPVEELMLPGGFEFTVPEGEDDENCLWLASSGDEKAKRTYLTFESNSEFMDWIDKIQKLHESKESQKIEGSIREGFLHGSTKQGTGFKRRYYVLLEDRIEFYSKRNDPQPEGHFFIPGGSVISRDDDNLADMIIHNCDDDGALQYVIRARDQHELFKWWEVVTVAASKNPNINEASIFEGYMAQKGSWSKYTKRYVVLTAKSLLIYASKHDPKPKYEYAINKKCTMNVKEGVKLGNFGTGVALALKLGLQGDTNVTMGAFEEMAKQWKSSIETAIRGRPKLFGGILSDAVKRSYIDGVPAIMHECIEWLEANGLEAEGIFRVPGSNEDIKRLRQLYEDQTTEPVKLSDVHTTAGVFKLYLRSLDDPLIPGSLYDVFVDIDDGSVHPTKAKTTQIKESLDLLPELNKNLIKILIDFLANVSKYSEVNKMGPANCAMVFAPSFMRSPPPPDGESDDPMKAMMAAKGLVAEMERSQHILELLIAAREEIFASHKQSKPIHKGEDDKVSLAKNDKSSASSLKHSASFKPDLPTYENRMSMKRQLLDAAKEAMVQDQVDCQEEMGRQRKMTALDRQSTMQPTSHFAGVSTSHFAGVSMFGSPPPPGFFRKRERTPAVSNSIPFGRPVALPQLKELKKRQQIQLRPFREEKKEDIDG